MRANVLDIATSGLNAAQHGLNVTGHNIANATTPGYSRQEVVQEAKQPQFTGSGFMGQGVSITTVRRMYSDYLTAQQRAAETRAADFDTRYAEIKQIDNLLGDAETGLGPALGRFFSAVQGVANDPSSVPSRQSMISTAQTLASRFQSLNRRLLEMDAGANTQIADTVTQINSYARQIANLNQQVAMTRAADPSQEANDLMDKRDHLVTELNKLTRTNAIVEANGMASVFIGNGQALVLGNEASELITRYSMEDGGRLEVAYMTPGGPNVLSQDMLGGGKLGGLLAYRSGPLDAARNALGRIAIGLAETFNAQHAQGQDLNGNLGKPVFSYGAPIVKGRDDNTGNAALSVTVANVAGLTASDYRLSYDGAAYTLQRVSDGTVQTYATLPQTVDGLTFDVTSGAMAAGDSFLVLPTAAGARDLTVVVTDPREVAAAVPIRTLASRANTGSGVISSGAVAGTPLNAALRNSVTITFTSPNTFDVVDTTAGATLATGVAYTSGGALSYNGWQATLSGTPAAGDTFTVQANTAGVGDGRNAVLLGNLQTAKTLLGSTASLTAAYAQLVAQVGNETSEMQILGETQNNAAEQARASVESLSGVNLDEEAAKLLRYQQAYQASAKVIDVASRLFDTLLNAVN